MVGALAAAPAEKERPGRRRFELVQGLLVGLSLRAERRDDGDYEVVAPGREPDARPQRARPRRGAGALADLDASDRCASPGGRFISPLERPCASVNTFPVLATEADDAVVGAAIVLPDHPQIAPESRGALFDSTEIEEALLLHVQALSDAEREEIERQDPAVREMIARAAAATPEEIVALHGRVTLRDPETERAADRSRPGPGRPTRRRGAGRRRRGHLPARRQGA